MQINNKLCATLVSILALGHLMSSCNKPDKIVLKNEGSIYMSQAAGTRATLALRLADTAQTVTFGAGYGGLQFAGQDINVSFKVDTTLVAAYNTLHGTTYTVLPSSSYTTTGLSDVIKAGTTSSAGLGLSISTKAIKFGTHYMLPIMLASASSGSIDSSLRTTYFAIDTITRLSVDITSLGALTVSHESNPPDANEGSLKLVDGDITTKFFTSGYSSDFWMQIKSTAANAVGAYTLTSGNDSPTRDPKNWAFVGSNDGATWTVLDTRVDQAFTGRNQTLRFEVDNVTPYNYYRLNITSNSGSRNFQMSEWRIIKYE